MIKSSFWAAAIAAVALVAIPAAAKAGSLDIPVAVPAEFRALVRAKLHSPQPRFPVESSFGLETKQGFHLSVFGIGDIVAVEVSKAEEVGSGDILPKHGVAVTDYVTRGTVTANRIEASFGDFGEVAVRFRPSGRVLRSKPRRRCGGPDRVTSRLGVFVGNIDFTGENRFISVRAHRARGRIRSPLHLHCAPRHPRHPVRRASRPAGSSPSFKAMTLVAGWRQAVDSTEFLAFQIGRRTRFLAVVEQSMGSMSEVRYALAVAPSRSFLANGSLTSASLTPPRPFSGRGIYGASPDGTTTWSGSMSASFPGAPKFPLTGSQFKATLAAGF